MSILRTASTAVAISVAGAGIAVGGIGLAAADDNGSGQVSTTQISSPADARGHGAGDRGGHEEWAAGLAEALGLQESDVTAALETVRDQVGPDASAEDGTRTPPTEAEREARQAAMVSALADELGVSEQQVTDALDSMVTDRKAEGRSLLADRLDAAVADGSLTAADKDSVLKAFDAGVLGGERGGPGGPGGHGAGATNS